MRGEVRDSLWKPDTLGNEDPYSPQSSSVTELAFGLKHGAFPQHLRLIAPRPVTSHPRLEEVRSNRSEIGA
jgi:hypothetical protein